MQLNSNASCRKMYSFFVLACPFSIGVGTWRWMCTRSPSIRTPAGNSVCSAYLKVTRKISRELSMRTRTFYLPK